MKQSDPPQRPKEEAFEVGLARYAKTKKRIPAWFLEYGGVLFVAAVVSALVLRWWIFGGGDDASEEAISRSAARLALADPPMKIWADSGSNRLQTVRVKVVNKGLVSAEDVKVSLVVGGNVFALNGPSTVASGKGEIFSGPVDRYIKEGEALNFSLTCGNCSAP